MTGEQTPADTCEEHPRWRERQGPSVEQLESAGMRLQTQVNPTPEEKSCCTVQGGGLPAEGPAQVPVYTFLLGGTAAVWGLTILRDSPSCWFPPPTSWYLLKSHVILTDTHKDPAVGIVPTFRMRNLKLGRLALSHGHRTHSCRAGLGGPPAGPALPPSP